MTADRPTIPPTTIPRPTMWTLLRLHLMWAWSAVTDPPLNWLCALPERVLGPRR